MKKYLYLTTALVALAGSKAAAIPNAYVCARDQDSGKPDCTSATNMPTFVWGKEVSASGVISATSTSPLSPSVPMVATITPQGAGTLFAKVNAVGSPTISDSTAGTAWQPIASATKVYIPASSSPTPTYIAVGVITGGNSPTIAWQPAYTPQLF